MNTDDRTTRKEHVKTLEEIRDELARLEDPEIVQRFDALIDAEKKVSAIRLAREHGVSMSD